MWTMRTLRSLARQLVRLPGISRPPRLRCRPRASNGATEIEDAILVAAFDAATPGLLAGLAESGDPTFLASAHERAASLPPRQPPRRCLSRWMLVWLLAATVTAGAAVYLGEPVFSAFVGTSNIIGLATILAQKARG